MLEKVMIRKMAQMVLMKIKQDLTSDAKSARKQIKDIALIATNAEKPAISIKIAQKISRHRSGGG